MGCKFICYDLLMTLMIQSHNGSYWTQLVSHEGDEGETVRTSCDSCHHMGSVIGCRNVLLVVLFAALQDSYLLETIVFRMVRTKKAKDFATQKTKTGW